MRPSILPPEEKFWNNVIIPSDKNSCWGWVGGKSKGYATIWTEKGTIKAHRLSYQLFLGSIPKGLCVCHQCDNKSCLNPDHLFLGTPLDNVRDCISKGRATKARGNNSGRRKHPDRYTLHNGGVRKLTATQVIAIREKAAQGILQKDIASEYNIRQQQISRIVLRYQWKRI